MSKDTPFVPVTVNCPICQQPSEQRYLKSKMFQPLEVENDQHVASYQWENPTFAHVRPNFYHLWHCPACHYVDEKEVFRGQDNCGGKLELLREKTLIATKAPGNLVGRLGQAVRDRSEFVAVETAITTHLLAVFLQELLSPNMRQTGKIARFYLRLAWLYREKDALGAPEETPSGFADYAAFLDEAAKQWPALPRDEKTAIQTAAAMYEQDLNQRRTDDPKFEINVMNLLSCLHERAGRLQDAMKYVRAVFSSAAKTRNGAKAAAQRGQSPEKMTALANWMNQAVEAASTRAEMLGELVFKEELPRAKEAVLQMGPVTAEQVTAKLRELKFANVTCTRVAAMFAKK